MKTPLGSQHPHFPASFTHVLGLALLCLLPSCGVTHPEYKALKARAQKDCKGDEVVGIWASEIRSGGLSGEIVERRFTHLLRADGTGRCRELVHGKITEADISWNYMGGGVWRERMRGRYDAYLRIAGPDLLYEQGVTIKMIFVNAGNEAAVNEFVSRRSSWGAYERHR